jgi:uncharacterized protein YllA (UPF0747 family)
MWGTFQEQVASFEGTLRRTAENASRAVQNRFLFMERKLVKAARRKDEVLRGRVDRILSSLYPRGKLQERTLTALPFLARQGRAPVEAAAREISLFAPEHRGVRLPA